MKKLTQLMLVIMLGTTMSLQAKWALLDNMDGLEKGNINGQTAANGKNWKGTSDRSMVANNPTDSNSLALKVLQTGWASLNAVEILEDGSKGTMFLRVYFGHNKTATTIGMSKYSSPDHGAHLRTADFYAGGEEGSKKILNLDIVKEVWYNVWIEYDLTATLPEDDKMHVYVSGGDYSERTYAGAASLSSTYWTSGDSLKSFYIPQNNSSWNRFVYYDDIYIDVDGLNETNPLEETKGTVLVVQ